MSDANQRRDLAADLAEYDGLSSQWGGWFDRLTLQVLGAFARKAYREAAQRAIAAEAEVERLRKVEAGLMGLYEAQSKLIDFFVRTYKQPSADSLGTPKPVDRAEAMSSTNERRPSMYAAVYDCNGEWVRGGYESLAQARESMSDEELESGSVVRHDGEV